MNIALFLLGSLVHTGIKYLDVLSSRRFTRQGVKEVNWLFRDANGYFAEWKAWVGVGAIQAVATFLFIYGPSNDPSGTMHPLHSLIVFVLSGLVSLLWYFKNKKAADRRDARSKIGPVI